jgi:diacylglycerol kinase (ATP)
VADESPFKGQTGIRRIWNALHFSGAGLRAAYAAEDAFSAGGAARRAAHPLGLLPVAEWPGGARCWLAGVLLVLIVELLNSAIEATVDRISMERHPLAKRAKDIGSAAVLLALLNCAGDLGLRC